jgi:hypothetical protein
VENEIPFHGTEVPWNEPFRAPGDAFVVASDLRRDRLGNTKSLRALCVVEKEFPLLIAAGAFFREVCLIQRINIPAARNA